MCCQWGHRVRECTKLGWDCEKGASDREELQVALQFTKKMRPKIFICENVPGILSSQHNVHLRTFLAGLIRDDYQVQTALHVAVSCCLYPASMLTLVMNQNCSMQAEHGVPATRKRMICIGALPGITLPSEPRPTHTLAHDHDTSNVLPRAYSARQVSVFLFCRALSTLDLAVLTHVTKFMLIWTRVVARP